MKNYLKFYLASLLIFGFCTYLTAGIIPHIPRPPRNVQVKTVPEGALVSWDFHTPDTVLTHNSGKANGLWLFGQKSGVGVIFDVSAYPSASLEEIDFAYIGGWDRSKSGKPPVGYEGTYRFRVHVYDIREMDNYGTIKSGVELFTSDTLEAPPAFQTYRYKTGVTIGPIALADTISTVGVFVEPLSAKYDSTDDKTYYYPALMTDDASYIKHVNFMCTNFDDPWDSTDADYSNIWELNNFGQGATNAVIDLWIQKQDGSVTSANFINSSSASTAGFYIFRKTAHSPLSKIGEVGFDTRSFLDTNAEGDSTYEYSVANHVDSLASEITSSKDYFHPKFLSITEARKDDNHDFIPDNLNKIVSIEGVINSPDFYGAKTLYFVQNGRAAISMYSGAFHIDLSIGDQVFVTGTIQQHRGLTEIIPDTSQSAITVLNHFSAVDTLDITLGEAGESYEGLLVSVENVELIDAENWPSSGQNGINLHITNGRDTVRLFIDQDTDLDGWTPPAGKFNLVAVVDQYTSASPPDDNYSLRPRMQSDFIPVTAIGGETRAVPLHFSLSQNYPNPFGERRAHGGNPSTAILYQLPASCRVHLTVYNTLGQKVKELINRRQEPGVYRVNFDGSHLASGIYFYRLQAGDFVQIRKMILLR